METGTSVHGASEAAAAGLGAVRHVRYGGPRRRAKDRRHGPPREELRDRGAVALGLLDKPRRPADLIGAPLDGPSSGSAEPGPQLLGGRRRRTGCRHANMPPARNRVNIVFERLDRTLPASTVSSCGKSTAVERLNIIASTRNLHAIEQTQLVDNIASLHVCSHVWPRRGPGGPVPAEVLPAQATTCLRLRGRPNCRLRCDGPPPGREQRRETRVLGVRQPVAPHADALFTREGAAGRPRRRWRCDEDRWQARPSRLEG